MKTRRLLPLVLAILVVFVWLGYWVGMGWYFRWEWSKSGTLGDTFGALNTLFTGLAFAGVVATLFQQSYQIQQTTQDLEHDRKLRLKLDLFDKRFRVYQAVRDFIGNVTSGNIGQAQVVQFDEARDEGLFLFAGDNDLLKYLEELRQRAGDYATWKDQSKGRGIGSQESKERDGLRDWFYAQIGCVREKFLTHLSFQ